MVQRDKIYWYITPNRIPYVIAFLGGLIGGMIFYHMNQTGFETMISKNQYLNTVPVLA